MLRLLWPFLLATALLAGSPSYELSGLIRPAGADSISLFSTATPFAVSTLTGEDGAFVFRNLEAGEYTAAVFFPDRGEARRTVSVGPGTADEQHRIRIALEFADADFAVAGTLRRHTVSAQQLSIPAKALLEFEAARQALSHRDAPLAASHLEDAVALAHQITEAWNELGTIAYQTGKYARAEECFRKALAADPKAFEPLVNLGGVLVTLRRTDEALTYNIQAVLARPEDALAQSQLGLAYFQAGNFELALKHLETARLLDPGHFSGPQLTIAEIHLRRGDRREAASDLEEFLKFHPDWPAAAAIRQHIALLRQ